VKTVAIVKENLDERLSSILASISDSLQVIHSDEDISSLIYMDPPDMIFIDRSYILEHDNRIIEEFRSNTIYGHLPVIAVYAREDLGKVSAIELPIDDYIVLDGTDLEIRRRIEFISRRAHREMDTNPLTRLPGNESIIRCIQQMFDEGKEIAIAWVDLDNFKPYNDRYGFSRGDEILLATSRIITNALKEIRQEDTFVGHVGGDDFVFICPLANVRVLCEEIVARFDMVIKNFYNDEDIEQGGIISTSRSGETTNFPFMTISIAVVMNEHGHYSHYGEASRDATDIKKYVKGLDGSNYMLDRRGGKPR
jgi:diguanylate cyclase (GGDEF)-like protein